MEYKVKTKEEQNNDIKSLEKMKLEQELYFDQLQLKNKLVGVDTYENVNEADRVISKHCASTMQILSNKFDKKHLFAIHEYLFQDIYYFAGKVRDVPMQIDSVTVFLAPHKIDKALDTFFERLEKKNFLKNTKKEEFVKELADGLTTLNIIHPFREGNGRTKRIFFQELAKQAGYDLDWSSSSKEEWKYADECSFDSARDGKRDTLYLELLLNKSISKINETKTDAERIQEMFGGVRKHKASDKQNTKLDNNIKE